MTTSTQIACRTDERRSVARTKRLNGIDSISVSENQLRLSVILFGEARPRLDATNLRIDGEPGAPVVTAISVVPCPDPDPEDPECLLVAVDGPGNWSCYTLSIVEAGPDGHPGTAPYPGFDQRCNSLAFTFKQNCEHPLDCAGNCRCGDGAAAEPGPVIDYLSRDYASLRQQLLDRLSLTLPTWTERHEADTGITLVELMAYAGDLLNYRLDAVGTEAFLDTARLRTSVRRHARLVDYRVHDGCAARAFVCLDTDADATLPAGTFRFRAADEVFEPLVAEDVRVRTGQARIELWAWGDLDCCLPGGATEAVLVGDELGLAEGDLLLFEEELGSRTGLRADADTSHRQVVRLTSVAVEHDDLYDQTLTRVGWAVEDALGFSLCVTARGGPDCVDLVVGVARGNLLVVGHGASTTWCGTDPEDLPWPGAGPTDRGCPCLPRFGCPPEGAVDLPAYPPRRVRRTVALAERPVTQQVPWPEPGAVCAAQAAALVALPPRVRARTVALLATDELSDDDLAWLGTIFGAAALDRYKVREHPEEGLPQLVARFDELLSTKLHRLDRLRCRVAAGYVLRQEVEGQELAWAWEETELIDPDRARVRGSAATVCTVDPRSALPAVRVEVTQDAGEPVAFAPVRDLLSSGPSDTVFVGEVDDAETLWLRFGDDRQGRLPRRGARLRAAYKVGNGLAGNVGAEAIDTLELCGVDPGEVRVRNPLAACGGTAPETLAEVRQRAPRAAALDVLARAVTAADYAQVAGEVPGVQRAACALRWTGSWYEADVAIDALGTETPPESLIVTERERLHRYRRIGHDVMVGPARLISLELALCVRVAQDHLAGHVRGALLDLLDARPGPDGRAFFDPDSLTFATPVRLSAIIAAVSDVPGVAGVRVSRLRRQFARPDDRALTTGVLELGELEVAQLGNDPSRPDRGLVELVIGGGR